MVEAAAVAAAAARGDAEAAGARRELAAVRGALLVREREREFFFLISLPFFDSLFHPFSADVDTSLSPASNHQDLLAELETAAATRTRAAEEHARALQVLRSNAET